MLSLRQLCLHVHTPPLNSTMPPHRSGISKSVEPRPATGDSLGLLRQRCGPLPAADCRAGRSSSWVGGELPPHGVKQHLFAMDHRSLQHARYSSECPAEWGRVHEVRRSQPRLSGPLIRFDVSPFCRWDSRSALLAGSLVPTGHTRFWRFTIEQPSRLFLSLAGFRACLLAGRR